jgi:hypothetical protein
LRKAFRAVVVFTALGAVGQLAALPVAHASSPPSRFIGQGTTYWEYMGNDGNGNLTVKFDSTQSGLAPNQADVTYTFDSGTQAFFVNTGQIVVTGDWVNGWDGTIASPPSHVHIGPFGTGTGISFHVDGYIAVQTAGSGQGPWEVDGSFTPTQSF